MVFVTLLQFIIACLFLVISGGMLVRALSTLALFLRMNEFVLAFFLLAFSTSLPELFIGVSAALFNDTALSLGNVIGSNIADLTLVAGIATLLGRGLKAKSRLIRKDAFWMIALAALPILLMLIGRQLSRLDGGILLVVFGWYVWRMIRQKRKFHAVLHDHVGRWQALGQFALFLLLIAVLFISAKYVVQYGSELSFELGLPKIFIGLFFVALGTSLPELVFESRAVMTGHPELALGDLIGSVVVNSLVVLGITAIIQPISSTFFLFITSSFFMIVVCFLFAVFLESRGGLSWKEGVVLLLMYVLFLLVELNLKGYYFNAGWIS